MAKAAYFGAPTPEYTQVEYIKSTEVQYIDTWIVPNQNTRVVAKLQCTAGSSANFIFGAREAAGKNAFQFFVSAYSPYEYTIGYNTEQIKFDKAANTTEPFILDFNKNTATIGSYTASATSANFTCPVSMVLFGQNTNDTMTCGNAAIYWLKIYDNGTLVRDFVPYKKVSGEACLYDLVSETFFFDSADVSPFETGAKIHDSTMGDYSVVARKFKKVYMGRGNVARRAKKSYIGIGGVARPYFNGEELTYYGEISGLYSTAEGLAATSNNTYALFAGGSYYNGSTAYVSNVTAYDKSLVKTAPSSTLYSARYNIAATTLDDYAFFAGGYGGSYKPYIDVYDSSLTRKSATDLGTATSSMAAASIGDFALFGGGTNASSDYGVSSLFLYNSSLTRATGNSSSLSKSRANIAASANKKYALFGGGSSYGTTVDAFDSSITRTSAPPLRVDRTQLAATNLGKYVLFGGGLSGTVTAHSAVDAYDESLTHIIVTNLSYGRYKLAATSVDGYALFGGGRGAGGYNNTVDAYDESLTHSVAHNLCSARMNFAATTIGNYALFGGGFSNGPTSIVNVVDAYTVR